MMTLRRTCWILSASRSHASYICGELSRNLYSPLPCLRFCEDEDRFNQLIRVAGLPRKPLLTPESKHAPNRSVEPVDFLDQDLQESVFFVVFIDFVLQDFYSSLDGAQGIHEFMGNGGAQFPQGRYLFSAAELSFHQGKP